MYSIDDGGCRSPSWEGMLSIDVLSEATGSDIRSIRDLGMLYNMTLPASCRIRTDHVRKVHWYRGRKKRRLMAIRLEMKIRPSAEPHHVSWPYAGCSVNPNHVCSTGEEAARYRQNDPTHALKVDIGVNCTAAGTDANDVRWSGRLVEGPDQKSDEWEVELVTSKSIIQMVLTVSLQSSKPSAKH